MSFDESIFDENTIRDFGNYNVEEELPYSSTGDDIKYVCFECLQPVAKRGGCGKCRHAVYCSKECQTTAWKHSGHKISCGVTKIASVEGKGFGVVACRDIKMGEVVIMERPILNITLSNYRRKQVNEEMLSLDDSNKRKLMSLYSHGVSGSKKLFSIVKLNSSSISNRTLVYNMISRLNHSCVPNVRVDVQSTDPNIFFTPVIALKDIPNGEELVYNYLVRTGIYSTRAERKAKLWIDYGIEECRGCPACSLTGQNLLQSDKNRLELKKVELELSTTGDRYQVPRLVKKKRRLLEAEGLDTMNYLMMLSKDLMMSADNHRDMMMYREEVLNYARKLHDQQMIGQLQ